MSDRAVVQQTLEINTGDDGAFTSLEHDRALHWQELGRQGVDELRAALDTEVNPHDTLGEETEATAFKLSTYRPDFTLGVNLPDQITALEAYFTPEIVKPEYIFCCAEHARMPIPSTGDAISAVEKEKRWFFALADEILGKSNACIACPGIADTMLPSDLSANNVVSSVPRYQRLLAGLWELSQSDPLRWQANLWGDGGKDDVSIEYGVTDDSRSHVTITANDLTGVNGRYSTRIPYGYICHIGWGNALQVHLEPADQTEYVAYHRAAEVASSLLIALSGSSPFIGMMPTGLKSSRLPLLDLGTNPNRHIHYTDHWIRDPFEYLAIGQEKIPLMPPEDDGKPLHAAAALAQEEAVMAAISNSKQCWPLVRTQIAFTDRNTVRLRPEIRIMSSGPTPIDEIGIDFLTAGLIPVLVKKFAAHGIGTNDEAKFEKFFPHQQMTLNNYRGAARGLEADVYWGDRGMVNACDLLKELLPEVQEELLSRGYNGEDVARALNPVHHRLIFDWDDVTNIPTSWKGKQGLSPADVKLYLDHDLQQDGVKDPMIRGKRITKFFVHGQLLDQEAYFQPRGRGEARSCKNVVQLFVDWHAKSRAVMSRFAQTSLRL